MDHSSWRFWTAVVRAVAVAVLAAGLWRALALHAQEPRACSSAETTAAMLNCANIQYEKAQQDLHQVYQTLLTKQDAIGRTKLQAAQAAWLQYRKANADFSADAARGGTAAPLLEVTALTDMTQARTAELKRLLH